MREIETEKRREEGKGVRGEGDGGARDAQALGRVQKIKTYFCRAGVTAALGNSFKRFFKPP